MISLDSNAADLLNSPNWIQDDIDNLNSSIGKLAHRLAQAQLELTERQYDLGVAYAKPENDRRLPHNGRNESAYETICRAIEKTVQLNHDATGIWISWGGENGVWSSATTPFGTVQDAWRAAFSILDRRQKSEVPNV